MEVIQSNFSEISPEVLKEIERATFISIDTELTGLWDTKSVNRGSVLDPPVLYYNRIRDGSMNFICVQFGLVAFFQDPTTLQYSCKAYSFYTFPRPVANFSSKFSFLCQPSSIDFLTKNNFDFNKTFYNGITYMNMDERVKFAEVLSGRRERDANRSTDVSPPIKIPPQHEDTVNDACTKLASVLSEECETEEVKVEGCNGFIRKLVYQVVREKYTKNELCVETKDGVLVSRKGRTKEEEAEEKKKRERNDEQLLEEAAGFSNVIQALSKSGKLVVGHNMLLDLCHTCHHFLCNIPKDYSEFKEVVSTLFPRLIDTKFIGSMDSMQELIKSTVLCDLYKRTSEPPFTRPTIDLKDGYGFGSDEQLHDAAYDAYITGVSFISLFNYLATPGSSTNPRLMKTPEQPSPVLNPVINRIFLRDAMDVHMNLGGKDPQPSRSHVFSVVFPNTWSQQEIAKLFSPYGPVQIWWRDETSAWVGLVRKDEARKVAKTLCKKSIKDVTVETYESAVASYMSPKSSKRQASPVPQSKRLRTETSLYQETPGCSDGANSRLLDTPSRPSKDAVLSQLEKCCTSDFGSVEQDWS